MKKGVVGVLSLLVGAAGGAIGVSKVTGTKINEQLQMSNKHLSLFLMMNQWVKVKQEGKNLASYFEYNGYKKIAIYGMSYAGETLLSELKGTDVQVAYGIDRNTLEPVDAVVVTAITFFDEIESKLSDKVNCPIISLEDVLYEV